MSTRPSFKTPLKRVLGRGAAHSGTEHFWQQRATAVANIPLVIIFIWFVLSHLGATRAEVEATLKHPVIAVVMIMALASVFWHMRVGLQVVIEDYIHAHVPKFTALALNIAFATTLFAISAYSILKMSL